MIGEKWIGVPVGHPFDRILQRIEAITGQQADVVQRFIDNGIVEAMVAGGHGIAILPRYTTRDHENGLVTRPLAGVRSERVIWAIQRPEVARAPVGAPRHRGAARRGRAVRASTHARA